MKEVAGKLLRLRRLLGTAAIVEGPAELMPARERGGE